MEPLTEEQITAAVKVVQLLMEAGVPAAILKAQTCKYVAMQEKDMPTISRVTISTLNTRGECVLYRVESTVLTVEQIMAMEPVVIESRELRGNGDTLTLSLG
jgi:hypothetical protein